MGGGIGAYYQGEADARTQDFFNPRADRGPSTGDITHYFNTDWIYELPRFTQIDKHRFADHEILADLGYILLARTGVAVQLSQAGTGLNVSRPDYVGGQAILGDVQHSIWCRSIPFRACWSGPETSATMESANPAQ